MEPGLFSERSLWTMLHGMVLGGGGMLGLGAALFALRAMRATPAGSEALAAQQARPLAWLLALTAALLWLSVLTGTYVVFPPYRATPPAGVTDLAAYPKALIQASPDTAWLHSFAMESKEHVPWLAAMIATAVAFVGVRERSRLLTDPSLNAMASALVAISFGLASYVALLGVLVNKVAPLE